MPSALNSNYANWPSFSTGFNMYDYIFEELMPVIYNWFLASDKREDNYIAGLSMGGRGTGVLAFNHPKKFAATAVLSATPSDLHAMKAGVDLPKLMFGCGESDGLYASFLDFKAKAKELELDAEIFSIPNLKHEWRFWDLAIQHTLDFFGIPAVYAGNPF